MRSLRSTTTGSCLLRSARGLPSKQARRRAGIATSGIVAMYWASIGSARRCPATSCCASTALPSRTCAGERPPCCDSCANNVVRKTGLITKRTAFTMRASRHLPTLPQLNAQSHGTANATRSAHRHHSIRFRTAASPCGTSAPRGRAGESCRDRFSLHCSRYRHDEQSSPIRGSEHRRAP
jgi:hypothetical protein